jgi:hypothetical protein
MTLIGISDITYKIFADQVLAYFPSTNNIKYAIIQSNRDWMVRVNKFQ